MNPTDDEALQAIPGIGPAVAGAILRKFGTKAAFDEAIEQGDLDAVANVEGMGGQRAVALFRQMGGRFAQQFLATPRARQLHEDIVERMGAFAATSRGRQRLRLLHPFAKAGDAKRHLRMVEGLRQEVAHLDRPAVRRALARLHEPVAAPARMAQDFVLVPCDDEVDEALRQRGLHRWVSFARRSEIEQEERLVVCAYEPGSRSFELDGKEAVVEVPAHSKDSYLAPNAPIAWFQANKDLLRATAEAHQLLGRAPPEAAKALAALDKLDLIPAEKAANLQAEAAAVAAEFDVLARAKMAAVTLSGDDVVAALSNGMPRAIQAIWDEITQSARAALLERTGIDCQAFVAGLPFTADVEEVTRIEAKSTATAAIKRFGALTKIAAELEPLQDAVTAEIEALMAYDAGFALGSFVCDYDLHPATAGTALSFKQGLHLDLTAKRRGLHGARADGTIQPISYSLGGQDTNTVVLTGANSGGKTTLMEHMAQIVLLHHMGLPVPGEDATVPWIDAIHVVAARRSLDAGAFESFLKGFLPVVEEPGKKLILADEVESVTELEAAGRILGFFLDRAAASDSLTLLVSHAASHILRHTQTARVRVDGIEATGLDDQHRLIVDREPRMGRAARSTPELIVQRLVATSKGAERSLYGDLLAAMQDPTASADAPVVAAKARVGG